MSRRHKHRTTAPRAKATRRQPASIEEVLSSIPGMSGAALSSTRAYLEAKRSEFPQWWDSQSVQQLSRLGQLFGPQYQG